MQYQQYSLAKALASFGKCSDVAHSIWMEQMDLPSDHKELLTSPIKSLLFFASYAHERAGRNPRFSLYHRIAIKKIYDAGQDVMSASFAYRVWEEFEKLTPYDEEKRRHKTNEKLTKGPVMEVPKRLRRNGEANLISHLRRMTLEEAHTWLTKIPGIGNKVASLLLRDIWSYIDKWPDTPLSHEKFLQPVDVWVRFWSLKAFPTGDWPRDDLRFAEQLVNRCRNATIDPVEFNKGAWFVGSHFYRLCHFFKVPEVERVDFRIVEAFDADAVLRVLVAFRDHEAMKAFWV